MGATPRCAWIFALTGGDNDSSIRTSFKLTLEMVVGVCHILGICFSGLETTGVTTGSATCCCCCCCCWRFRSFCEIFSGVADSPNERLDFVELEEACAMIPFIGSFSGRITERHDFNEDHSGVDGWVFRPDFGVTNGPLAV